MVNTPCALGRLWHLFPESVRVDIALILQLSFEMKAFEESCRNIAACIFRVVDVHRVVRVKKPFLSAHKIRLRLFTFKRYSYPRAIRDQIGADSASGVVLLLPPRLSGIGDSGIQGFLGHEQNPEPGFWANVAYLEAILWAYHLVRISKCFVSLRMYNIG